MSRITAILLNEWILPIGGASVVEGLLSTGPTPSSFIISYSICPGNGQKGTVLFEGVATVVSHHIDYQ